jgi:superfamily II DNA or RNA helicase
MTTLRDYQKPAVKWLARTYRGILKAPAGSGKTLMAAAALAHILDRRDGRAKVCLLCNTIEQVGQWQAALDAFPIIARQADCEIGCGAGNMDPTGCDLLIVDECHRAASPSWSAKVGKARNARWGVSATPFGKDKERNDYLRELFGTETHTVERTELVENGHLAKGVVLFREMRPYGVGGKVDQMTAELIDKRRRKMPWMFRTEQQAKEQERQCCWQAAQQIGLWENPERDSKIVWQARIAIDEGRSVIVLVGKIEHGLALKDYINIYYLNADKSHLCYSKMGRNKRAETIEAFKAGKIRCLVATSMLEEGFDAPIADCIIMAGGGRSARKTIQATGRVLRSFEGKTHGKIIDFTDDFTPMLRAQSFARRRIYRELGYEIQDQVTTL